MVNFRNLTDKAKDLVDKRGGTDSLKRDAEELKGIAKGPGSISDKAKAAVSAIKDPGESGTKAAKPTEPVKAGTAPVGEAHKAAAEPAETPKQAAGKAKHEAAERTGKHAEGGGAPSPEESGGAK